MSHFLKSISVISAVEGLAKPLPAAFAKGSPASVGLAAGILALLFLVQHRGTASVAFLFSPVAAGWFVAIAGLGVHNLVAHGAGTGLQALSAVSPHHAVRFFAANGAAGWRALGSTMLAITGAEALYADLVRERRGGGVDEPGARRPAKSDEVMCFDNHLRGLRTLFYL